MNEREALKLVSQIEAARILFGDGWRKVPCVECKGVGFFDSHPPPYMTFTVEPEKVRRVCETCDGAKFTWGKP